MIWKQFLGSAIGLHARNKTRVLVITHVVLYSAMELLKYHSVRTSKVVEYQQPTDSGYELVMAVRVTDLSADKVCVTTRWKHDREASAGVQAWG